MLLTLINVCLSFLLLYIMNQYQQQKLNDFKGQNRLPKFAIPHRYDLTLKPDLQVCTFSGHVTVELSILDPTRFLVLNSIDLVIHDTHFTGSNNHKVVPSEVVVDKDDEALVVVFDEALNVGQGVLEIKFSGVLNEHMKGLYKGTYVDEGVRKNMAVTQFEPADARRCFPCWDEPALKATFKITADNVPSALTVLSNMPVSKETINGDFKTVSFEESPAMSTYLVAVVVGLFDYIEETTSDGIRVRAYCPVGKSDKGKLALSISVKSLELYTKYFSMPYMLPKLDMVAVPDFSGGAMENYGLITYRETELLHDDLHSAAANTQRLSIVVTHEVGHQWFGNLVTLEWWTHLWLNEGFATWVSYLATDTLFPEWRVWRQFLEVTAGGLRMDSLEQSHPVEVEVGNASSVLEVFDEISYNKGSSLVRMVNEYLGDEIFQKALSSYVKKYTYKNAKTEDLWAVLSDESGVEVNKLMDIWTKQTGYPLISVKLQDSTLQFDQTRFTLLGQQHEGQWIIPITLSMGSYSNCKKLLLETKVGKLDISELYHSYYSSLQQNGNNNKEVVEKVWVKVNVGHSGFYRVKYDESLTARLRKAIEDKCLSPEDKFGILDDTYALCEAGEESILSLISLMDLYRDDLDYLVLSRLITACYNTSKILKDAIYDPWNHLNQFFIDLIISSAEKLGMEPVYGECLLNSMLREEVYMALATFGHKETHEELKRRFQTYVYDKTTSVFPVDIRKAVYISIMKTSSVVERSEIDSLLKLYKETDAVQEKTRILSCLASSPDPDMVIEILNLMFTEEVREQDTEYVTARISMEARETAWIWLKENWDTIIKRWGQGMVFHHFIRDIVTPFSSHEMAEEVKEFFNSRVTPSFARNLKQSIEQIRIKANWVDKIRQEESLIPKLARGLTRRPMST
ncbi:aminopeptidase M1-like [Rutidosis leptorrhynchoides]|uniref:aminopeptidase M1-like n=1 Tax=Rutidosis leptorrhynchoides TaxID=125765 RepID=UPI003A99F334